MFNHLMIDLETMGNKPSSPILAIGAVFFSPQNGELGEEFYTPVNLESAMAGGAIPDADTIIWWLKQSSEARAAVCVDGTPSLMSALYDMNKLY
ncbi:prophage exonuclease [Erwinia tracheiphila PSU-1]|nr:prophage exonuclease [Erwinia tracheiphila PSU-1]